MLSEEERSARYRRGKTQPRLRCRIREDAAKRSLQQQSLELVAVQGEREHDDISDDDDELYEDDGVDKDEKSGEGAEAKRMPEGASKGPGNGPNGSAREKGTRGTIRPGRRKRKYKDVLT